MKLELASHQAVKYACLNFHYGKSLPLSLCAYSVFNNNNEWCGCIVYSTGANPNHGKQFGIVQGEVCELVRVALNGKQESTSKALAISIRLLKKANPLLKLIISYADCDQHHIGTLYQATNFIYAGKVQLNGGTPRIKVLGKVTHGRTIGKRGWKQNIDWIRKHIDPAAEKVYTTGKLKYLYPLTEAMKEKVKQLAQPYPKANAVIA